MSTRQPFSLRYSRRDLWRWRLGHPISVGVVLLVAVAATVVGAVDTFGSDPDDAVASTTVEVAEPAESTPPEGSVTPTTTSTTSTTTTPSTTTSTTSTTVAPTTSTTTTTAAPTTTTTTAPPVADNCPNGDFTGNQYDGACGTPPTQPPPTAPPTTRPPQSSTGSQSQTLTCTADAELTAEAEMVSGDSTVTIAISGPVSNSSSGAGKATTRVDGPPGTYRLTATGDITVGFFLGYSDTGGTCV